MTKLFERKSSRWLPLLCMCASCATAPTAPSTADNPLPQAEPGIVLQEGDVVDVRFVYWPELNEVQSIRSDGKITLQLVNEVQAAGLAPEELRLALLDHYADKLRDPEITVIARVDENRRVYVGGEVNAFRNNDGLVEIPLSGRMTVLEAIMISGGLKERSAKISNVLIIRRMDDTQYARTLDLRPLFKEAEVEPFYLQANDIVFVPRTNIDRVDQWVDQYLNQPVPDWIRATVDMNNIIRNNRAPEPADTVTFGPTGVTLEQVR